MTDDRTLPMTEQVPMSDFERAFRDACDEAGCEYDNEALLVAIANLTSYPDMLWEWFTVRRGSDDMRANASQGGLSADDFKQMLDEHEANLIPATPDSTASLKARIQVLTGEVKALVAEFGDQEHKDCDCRACGIIRNARADLNPEKAND
jgi:hypothetical protein